MLDHRNVDAAASDRHGGAEIQQGHADMTSIGTGLAEREIPVVKVLRVVAIHRPIAPGDREVTVRCPFCRRLHFHGWPAGEVVIGHRLPHCIGKTVPNNGYDIAVPV